MIEFSKSKKDFFSSFSFDLNNCIKIMIKCFCSDFFDLKHHLWIAYNFLLTSIALLNSFLLKSDMKYKLYINDKILLNY
jgi:hypothetical protein